MRNGWIRASLAVSYSCYRVESSNMEDLSEALSQFCNFAIIASIFLWRCGCVVFLALQYASFDLLYVLFCWRCGILFLCMRCLCASACD